MVVWRLVVPAPSSFWLPDMLARFASGPVVFVMPASAATVLVTPLVRCVLEAPLATAEADSATTIVTRSFTWLAFRSRPRSANCALGVHNDPAVGAWLSARCAASAAYLSSGESSGTFFSFLAAAPHVKTVQAIAISTAADGFIFIGSPRMQTGISPLHGLSLRFSRGRLCHCRRCARIPYRRDVRPIRL